MKPNSGLIGADGYQVCLYPLPVLSITQTSGPDSFSHCCGNPFDAVGSSAQATLYAPCDCTLYYRGTDAGGNTCSFTSDKRVITPSGLKYVSFQFTHGNLLGNGKTYKQGQPIYTTGIKGMVTGDHVHIDQALKANAPFINSGVVCSYGNQCWQLEGSVSSTRVFYINDTTVYNSAGLNFQTYKGGIPTTSPDDEGEILNWIIPVIESDPYERSRILTDDEAENNAKCFYGYMSLKYGWTLNACCGVLGNAYWESSINPNRWQGDYKYTNPVNLEGFGLVQWTPWTKITTWLEDQGIWKDFPAYGNAQCERIQGEVDGKYEQWYDTPSYRMTFKEFTQSTQSPEYLVRAFFANYERGDPYVAHMDTRIEWANRLYSLLSSWTPVLPGSAQLPNRPGGRSHKSKWIYYLKRSR